ncbi:MAG: deoxyribodipyrimidine photo-lyase [Candidatus Liberibacter europaeus]|uniref:Deoxyribodipyrimidine photo-lyase n=1 Tax=Candidatus Liberibacter europaeus TaxID=744859 RepID=A0A2T4VWT9_9HYPH|nr:deoxyribodipyrimidine photo-lyase [Candidatus Liberibacter europaeus]PTL86244.1 MAG: deoxyribodipyrimidine photo-lyase [Candidatus Liberibacter europaeus]
MITHLVWLRNDLRISDNTALNAACKNPNAKVIAVFIATPEQWLRHNMSPRQATFIYETILQLQKSLAKKGISFIYHQCADFDDSVKWLNNYCYKQQVTKLFYNRQYEINERQRDQKLEQCLKNKIICSGFDDNVILPPGSVLKDTGQMYKIYTPFRKAFIQHLIASDIQSLPIPTIRHNGSDVITKIPPHFNYPHQAVDKIFPAGENNALQLLKEFCREKAPYYDEKRNIPAINGTSRLSPYLAIGALSPRQCFNKLLAEFPDILIKPYSGGAFSWLNELIWREFYRHLIVAYPFLCMGKPFITWTEKIRWNHNRQYFNAWKQGLTGFPIVDAAMRQLNTIGWMHNRLRMISASFLVKDLLIDWRIGEQYFMSQLLDGDFASNNGGWQWAASTGNDSVPYFRIFNPTTQGKRFDPNGTFIRQWIPELTNVPDKHIHNPHNWTDKDQNAINYPSPIVDHDQARKKAIMEYSNAKNESTIS